MAVSDPVSLKSIDAIKPRQRRGTVVLADAGSISSRRFDPTFVELCKVPGNDVWLIEFIETADDILDAFLPGLAKLVIPVSGIRGRGVLEEALSLSDQCVPLVSVRNGRADWGRGGPLEAVKDLADTGYGKIMVWDIGGELPPGFWESASRDASIISYVPGSRRLTDDVLTDVLPPVPEALG